MNFSEVFKLSSLLCKFSPDGKYLVSDLGARGEAARGSANTGLPPGTQADAWNRGPGARGSGWGLGGGPGRYPELGAGDPAA